MQDYVIRNHDNGVPTGYFGRSIGDRFCPQVWSSRRAAEREAAKLNSLPHAPGRIYVVELLPDED
jgi:hypothetical protein